MHYRSSFYQSHARVWASLFACASLVLGACSSSSSSVTSPTSVRCPVELGVAPATLDAAGGSGQISIAVNRECTWDARSEASWITLVAPTSGQGDATLRFSAAANTTVASRRGAIVVNDQRIEVMQSATACRFELSAPGGAVEAGGGSLAVSVTSQATCRWSAVSEVDWIRVDAGREGEANGVVQMSVSANPGPVRQGAVLIAGVRYTVSQQGAGTTVPLPPPQPLPPPGCSYTLSPDAASFPSAGGEATITVQTSAPACTWSAESTVPWVTVATPSGTGAGTVRLVASANTGAERSGMLVIAGLTVPVSQAAAPAPNCDFTVSPRSADVGNGGGEGTIAVRSASASCTWSASSNASWLTVTPRNGTGSGDVRYVAAANTGAARTGTISVAGVVVTIAQAAAPAPPPCEYEITPRNESFESAGGSGMVRIRASGSSCSWTAASNASWISVAAGSGTGDADLRYTVAANTGAARTGTITVRGVTITIAQAAAPAPAPCEYDVAPRNESFVATGGDGTIRVRSGASCAWTAASNAPWITVTSGTGTGNADLRYTVAANTGGARSGTITVAGVTVTIAQEAAAAPPPPPPPPACQFDAAPRSESYPSAGGSGGIRVTASAPSCAWPASSNVPWITLASGGGTGDGEVRYTVAANTGSARTGTITVGGVPVTITQDAAPAPPPCQFDAAPRNEAYPAAGGAGGIRVTASAPSCAWTAVSNAPWISLGSGGGTGDGELRYTVAANTGGARSGTITVGTVTVTIAQEAAPAPPPPPPPCQFDATPRNESYSALGGAGTIRVTASAPTCAWPAATSDASWISLASTGGTGDGEVRYTVAPNLGAARTGTLTVAGISITIAQAAVLPTPVQLGGAIAALSGTCPNLSIVLDNRQVVTNGSTDFQRGDCDWFRTGRDARVLGLVQPDGTVLALQLQRGSSDN